MSNKNDNTIENNSDCVALDPLMNERSTSKNIDLKPKCLLNCQLNPFCATFRNPTTDVFVTASDQALTEFPIVGG